MRSILRIVIFVALITASYFAVTATSVNAANHVITRDGSQLERNSKPFSFTGVNAYELATHWDINEGCGGMLSDQQMDTFFGSLRPNSVVRFWVFQDLATNKHTGERDWRAIDRVFRYAEKHNQYLLPTIGNHWPECDGGTRKDDLWYTDGYKKPFSPDGKNRVSYQEYMNEVVSRYKDSFALGMWSLMNEPEMSCGKAQELKKFFDEVGGELKKIDPAHLLEMGVIGENQCSMVGGDYRILLSSSVIDVASFHDYDDEQTALPSLPAGSSLKDRIIQAKQANKPIIVGEAGIFAARNGNSSCQSLENRRDMFEKKISAAFDAGVSGYLPWNFVPEQPAGCSHDITQDDPTMHLLKTIPLPTSGISGQPQPPTPPSSSPDQPVSPQPNPRSSMHENEKELSEQPKKIYVPATSRIPTELPKTGTESVINIIAISLLTISSAYYIYSRR